MKEVIASLLAKATNLKKEEILNLIEIPPQGLGDYAFPCFVLAKKHKKAPEEIAKELARKIKMANEISQVKSEGAYLNFFINKNIFAENVLKKVLKEKDYGKGKEKNLIMIEFSQANTHKAFHIGHIRGISIGESLSRIFSFNKDKVIRVNYQGDTGMHVAKWLWCYLKHHKKEKIRKDEAWIASIYVDAIKKLAENEKLQEEVEEINRKLEKKEDRKLNKLWKKTRKLSLDSLEPIYKDLNTKFNKYYFESEMEKRGKEISLYLEKKGIAKLSDGAIIMDLEKYGLGIWVLLRKDRTVLYSAKDLALAEKKFLEYKLNKCIYVVADEQTLHFKQLFKTLSLMGFKNVEKCIHVPFATVRLPHGKMSSRTGENVLYSEFKSELVEKAKKEVKKRFPKIKEEELKSRTLKIAVAAMKYPMLKHDPNKIIVFNPEEAISFEGNTGPYLQYSYARASSILRKAKKKTKIEANFKIEEKEFLLIKKLEEFKEIINQAYAQLNPSLLANYSFQLAQIFNEFYHSCPVINSNQEEFRLSLVLAFKIVIKQALFLLGIEVMEEM